jgi:hypothetical protein
VIEAACIQGRVALRQRRSGDICLRRCPPPPEDNKAADAAPRGEGLYRGSHYGREVRRQVDGSTSGRALDEHASRPTDRLRCPGRFAQRSPLTAGDGHIEPAQKIVNTGPPVNALTSPLIKGAS